MWIINSNQVDHELKPRIVVVVVLVVVGSSVVLDLPFSFPGIYCIKRSFFGRCE